MYKNMTYPDLHIYHILLTVPDYVYIEVSYTFFEKHIKKHKSSSNWTFTNIYIVMARCIYVYAYISYTYK